MFNNKLKLSTDKIASEALDSVKENTKATNILHDKVYSERVVTLAEYPRLNGETDDTERIDRAITHLYNLGGGRLEIKEPELWVRNISIKDKVSVVGNGMNSTTIYPVKSDEEQLIGMDIGVVQRIEISNMRIRGNNLNPRQHGIRFVAKPQLATPNHGGLWYSKFSNLVVEGFDGEQIGFVGGYTSSLLPNQFNKFQNVFAYHSQKVGSYAFSATGQNGQFSFDTCQFDGAVYTDKFGTSVRLSRGFSEDGVTPLGGNSCYSFEFKNTTIQCADKLVELDNVKNISFSDATYFEKANKGIEIKNTSWNVSIQKCQMSDVGDNGGSGYCYDVKTSSRIKLHDVVHIGKIDNGVVAAVHQGIDIKNCSGLPKTTGVTTRVYPTSNTIDLKGMTSVWLDAGQFSTIQTINTSLLVGEQLIIRCNGDFTFQTGGNLNFGGNSSIKALDGDIMTFVVLDINNVMNFYLLSKSPDPSLWEIRTLSATETTMSARKVKQVNLNQSGVATITNFTNATDGQEFTIVAFNANTTIQHSTTLKLKGAANANIPNGGVITLVYSSNSWYEKSRNF